MSTMKSINEPSSKLRSRSKNVEPNDDADDIYDSCSNTEHVNVIIKRPTNSAESKQEVQLKINIIDDDQKSPSSTADFQSYLKENMLPQFIQIWFINKYQNNSLDIKDCHQLCTLFRHLSLMLGPRMLDLRLIYECGNHQGCTNDASNANDTDNANNKNTNDMNNDVKLEALWDHAECVRTIGRILENIVNHSSVEKYRTISSQSNSFKSKIANQNGGEMLLQYCGFKQNDSSSKQQYVLPTSVSVETIVSIKSFLDFYILIIKQAFGMELTDQEIKYQRWYKFGDFQLNIIGSKSPKQGRQLIDPKWKKLYPIGSSRHGEKTTTSNDENDNGFDKNKKWYTLKDLKQKRINDILKDIKRGKVMQQDTIDDIGKHALELTNQFRQKNGLMPLKWDPILCQIGKIHSINMGDGNVPVGHQGFKQERVPLFPRSPVLSAAENVAMTCSSAYGAVTFDEAKIAVDGWIESPGHRQNLLGSFNYCGIGVYCNASGRCYFTQLFSKSW